MSSVLLCSATCPQLQLFHSTSRQQRLFSSRFRQMSPPSISYNNKIFRSASNTPNGEVSASTRFAYHQDGNIVWAEYAGGSIAKGFLIATVQPDSSLDARYEHVNIDGALMTGKCKSTPELLADGRIRLHEQWQWTSGDQSSGSSVVEESTTT